MKPSAHLLRTLAAVAPGARVVDGACGDGRHLVPLAQLGFDVWGATSGDPGRARARLAEVLGDAADRVVQAAPDALDRADASADWGVVALDEGLDRALVEMARVLRPGAWVWVETENAAELPRAAALAGLVEAEEPAPDGARTHAIYRRPGRVG